MRVMANWRLRKVIDSTPRITLEINSGVLNSSGMVVDFGDLEFAVDALDPSVINEAPYFAGDNAPPPTADGAN